MTPKELTILYETMEHLAEHFYKLGRADEVAKKPMPKDFKLSKASRLSVKTEFERALRPKPVDTPKPRGRK